MRNILDLPEEILVEILRVCDVVDVLHLEIVSVRFTSTPFLDVSAIHQLK